jgi:VRR-NUC domain
VIPTASESSIQKAILAWLRLHGAWCVRCNGGAVKTEGRFIRFTDTVGTPDILACVGGRMVGIECKRKGGKLSPAQGECLDAINRAGGLAFVATSIEDVERALRAEGLL